MICLSPLLECENFIVLTPKLTNLTNSGKTGHPDRSKLASAGFETFPKCKLDFTIVFSCRDDKKSNRELNLESIRENYTLGSRSSRN